MIAHIPINCFDSDQLRFASSGIILFIFIVYLDTGLTFLVVFKAYLAYVCYSMTDVTFCQECLRRSAWQYWDYMATVSADRFYKWLPLRWWLLNVYVAMAFPLKLMTFYCGNFR